MVALIVSLVITFAMAAGIFVYAKRRKVGTPVTWGEAVLAGTYVFALLFMIYGVVPHQWLTYADTDLQWRKDAIVGGAGLDAASSSGCRSRSRSTRCATSS